MNVTEGQVRPLLQVELAAFGRASLRKLDWDTRFFGAESGVIDLVEPLAGQADRRGATAALLRSLLSDARAEGYAHLIYRPGAEDWEAVHGTEDAGLLLVDLGVDFAFHYEKTLLADDASSFDIRPSRDEDLPALRDLAGSAFRYSRFNVDPFFSDAQVEAFHREWVTNLYNGLAQAVLVCEEGGELAGFVSCAISGQNGRIPLIATAESHRGKGVATALVQAALRWFHDNGATVAFVKTQATNVPAVALYERNGFVLDRSELTYSVSLAAWVEKEVSR